MKTSRYIQWVTFGLLMLTNQAVAIDLQPGELRSPKPDTNLLMLSYQQSERGNSYLHGYKQSGNPEIRTSQLQVRLGRSFEVAEHPAFFYVQTPLGYTHPAGSLSAAKGDAGVGDTTFLLAIWPYANNETKNYFAVGAYLTAPTGSYDHERSFNVGQNRYSTALQAGYQAPLVGTLNWMAALDAIWFWKNDAFGHNRNTLAACLTSSNKKRQKNQQITIAKWYNSTC